jgi:hypothetical protein
MKKVIQPIILLLLVFSGIMANAQKEFVQRIMLDKPVTAGPLKVFPLVEDPNSYYYLPNKVRLGVNENGTPQFSFIRFVDNVRSGANDKEATVGQGGGYVHLLVGLIVTPDEVKTAEQELKNINPRAKIVGSVVYRGGTMALITKSVITNANNASGEGQRRVLGIGPAPVLEGDKIAVSFLLDKTDATLLWESLKSSTPDISFNLNMTLAGYQSPVEFRIEMDWDKIYNHEIFNAGVATPILQAEIGLATQQLQETGAIKITQIGEDPNMQRLQDLLTNKMIDMCFVPFGREGSPNWNELAQPLNGGQSFLDRATTQLNEERQRQRENNNTVASQNLEERRYTDEENRRRREEAARNNSGGSTGSTGAGSTGASSGGSGAATETEETDGAPEAETAESVREGRVSPRSTATAPRLGPAFSNPANFRNGNQGITDAQPQQQQPEGLQSINIVASFQKKTVKHTGKYTAEAKTYFTTSLTEVFGGNIGRINCRDCLREVNLDDPLYKQRELVCFIDGEISQDFDKFINYVTVSMRKKHPAGDITTDELRVDRKNFNSEGNNFKLMYGWKAGDNDRRNWLNYEYKTVWNFFGGGMVESEWQPSVNPVIPLKAPVKRRTVNIIAEQDNIKKNNIRSVTVRVYYTAGGKEQFKQTSLNLSRQVYSAIVDFILPSDQPEYEFEIDWMMGNNQVVKSARQKSSFDDIFVDSPPGK